MTIQLSELEKKMALLERTVTVYFLLVIPALRCCIMSNTLVASSMQQLL